MTLRLLCASTICAMLAGCQQAPKPPDLLPTDLLPGLRPSLVLPFDVALDGKLAVFDENNQNQYLVDKKPAASVLEAVSRNPEVEVRLPALSSSDVRSVLVRIVEISEDGSVLTQDITYVFPKNTLKQTLPKPPIVLKANKYYAMIVTLFSNKPGKNAARLRFQTGSEIKPTEKSPEMPTPGKPMMSDTKPPENESPKDSVKEPEKSSAAPTS